MQNAKYIMVTLWSRMLKWINVLNQPWKFFFFFLGPHPWHMEVPRLGVKSELQLLAYTTAIATRDPSHIFDPHHSSRQHQIPDPLSEARERTCILMDTSRIPYHCTTMETPNNEWMFLINWMGREWWVN